MFLEVGVASTGVPGYRPVALAPTGVRAETNLPWRYASREGRAVLAVGNARGGTRVVELGRPRRSTAEPSQLSLARLRRSESLNQATLTSSRGVCSPTRQAGRIEGEGC